ncbi:MAG: hypothetical protein UX89_C0004G0013 [Parcubacteria group bacterium GW2011_GWA2_47_16]|nr:MAG: hypothetical protein UX89_C0004G0013 [Parcubacteria group bacterium GW2011_GWA2_47_16]
MDKDKKYKFVFDSAEKFLNEIIDEHKLDHSIIKGLMLHQQKFEDLFDALRRLIVSLQNRGMMSRVIQFENREKEIKPILFNYDFNKILATYKDASELLEKFKNKKEFNLQNTQSKGNLWRIFSEGIISGSTFVASFQNKDDFDSFVKSFFYDKYTKAALPMLLSKEIHGFGFPLSCDFLKELGYRDYPKADVHLITIFYELGLSGSTEPYEVYKSIIEMVEVVGKDAFTVDKIFWLIGSGKLVGDKSIGDYRDKFIKRTKMEMDKILLS